MNPLLSHSILLLLFCGLGFTVSRFLTLLYWKLHPVHVRLYFDDERNAPKGWIVVRPNEMSEIIAAIVTLKPEAALIDAISFDHDLGDGYPSGYDFFCMLEEAYHVNNVIPPMLYVHSMNAAGRQNIVNGIDNLNRYLGRDYNCQVLPE